MADEQDKRVVIKVLELMNGGPFRCAGQYLEYCDFDAHDGGGFAKFTDKPELAMKFDNGAAAFKYWTTTSTVKPLREDDQPNRPLTAFSVEFVGYRKVAR